MALKDDKISLIATLNGHVQILNVLPARVSEKFERTSSKLHLYARMTHQNLEILAFFDNVQKTKTPQIQYLQGFERIEEI